MTYRWNTLASIAFGDRGDIEIERSDTGEIRLAIDEDRDFGDAIVLVNYAAFDALERAIAAARILAETA